MTDLTGWRGAPRPERQVIEGRYTRLEPLQAAAHAEGLFAASSGPGAEARFRYLFETAPGDQAQIAAWITRVAAQDDPLFYAVIDRATGEVAGRQALMRIDPGHGVIEIGNILWGPLIARSRAATEALYLFAAHVFALGYRRFEWKCNALNLPSRVAAERFGFRPEGIFRQHMVVKGQNRDTAWFAMTDADWPRLAAGYQRWLDPANFTAEGKQLSRLHFDPAPEDPPLTAPTPR